MKLIGLVRLGRDCEVRYTPDGTAVCGFSGAFNYGRKGDDGRQPSQWVEFSMFGQRAEKLSEYLLKGTQVMIIGGDVHVETYDRRDGGTGVKLVARVEDLQFAGQRQQEGSAPAPRASAPAPRAPAPKPAGGGTGFDDMDDDLPF